MRISFLLLLPITTASALQVGDNVCAEGYIMDFFCIRRGTLLDNPGTRTLIGPDRHTVHCLVDEDQCVESPFEVFLPPLPGEQSYARGYRIEPTDSKAQVVTLARTVGTACSTCFGGGTIRRGLHLAALNATVVDLGTEDVPPTIRADEWVVSSVDNLLCPLPEAYSVMPGLDSTEGEGVATVNTPPRITGGVDNSLQKRYYAHASLMLIGWGWLIPSGAILARFLKHRPIWFHLHRAVQSLGLLSALIGFIIALKNFETLDSSTNMGYNHAVMGVVTMALGLFQPINGLVRPHAAEDGDDKTSARVAWEFVHKGLGYAAIVLAIVTVGLGTTLLPDPDDQKFFQIAFGLGAGFLLFVLAVFAFVDGDNVRSPPRKTIEETEEGEPLDQDKA